jgi:hypothetical protein
MWRVAIMGICFSCKNNNAVSKSRWWSPKDRRDIHVVSIRIDYSLRNEAKVVGDDQCHHTTSSLAHFDHPQRAKNLRVRRNAHIVRRESTIEPQKSLIPRDLPKAVYHTLVR